MNFCNFPYFQLWVRPFWASFFKYESIFGYHCFCFLRAPPKAFLRPKMYALLCTSRLHPLHFVIFPQNSQICVVNAFICSCQNIRFYFPNVSCFKSIIFQLSNALSTMFIAILDPEIS